MFTFLYHFEISTFLSLAGKDGSHFWRLEHANFGAADGCRAVGLLGSLGWGLWNVGAWSMVSTVDLVVGLVGLGLLDWFGFVVVSFFELFVFCLFCYVAVVWA